MQTDRKPCAINAGTRYVHAWGVEKEGLCFGGENTWQGRISQRGAFTPTLEGLQGEHVVWGRARRREWCPRQREQYLQRHESILSALGTLRSSAEQGQGMKLGSCRPRAQCWVCAGETGWPLRREGVPLVQGGTD